GNGVFAYGGSQFPTGSWNASNYYVDVSFLPAAGDTTIPSIAITAPTSAATHATSQSTISLAGTASDNKAVTEVSWSNDRGGYGLASGTTSWSAAGIALQIGVNRITVTATDSAGNYSIDQITVTYTPAADTTGPAVTSTSPAAGATDVPIAATIQLTFNEALATGTVNSSTFELRSSANVLVPAVVS